MQSATQHAAQDNPPKRLKLELDAEQQQILFKTISDFATSASSQLLKAFSVTWELLDTNPVEWDGTGMPVLSVCEENFG